MVRLSHFSSHSSITNLTASHPQRYVLEALRLDPAVSGIVRRCTESSTVQECPRGDSVVNIEKDELVYCSFVDAGRDPAAFSEPDKVNLSRDERLYSTVSKGVKSGKLGAPSSCRSGRAVSFSIPL
jgi:cytochrome P450